MPGSGRHYLFSRVLCATFELAPRLRRNQSMRMRIARRADLSAPVADFGNDHTRYRRNDVRCQPLHIQVARLVCIAAISPEPRGTMIIITPATVRSRDNPSRRLGWRGQKYPQRNPVTRSTIAPRSRRKALRAEPDAARIIFLRSIGARGRVK
jgi:hypothetical protein